VENEAARALARIDREIWIITAQASDGRRGGLLATWVQQVSLDDSRPAILIALHPDHYTRELIDASGAFTAHLLRDNQVALALRFAASSGRDADKLADLSMDTLPGGASRLRECVAWAECRVFSRLATGDRIFYWADCIAGGAESTATPLRESMFFKSLPSEDVVILRENRRRDIEAVRSATDPWRAQLPDILRFSPTE
jgi:flavin reductase (DIM6/NTAB) family NADH-FMN oxidoreductase RutF